MEERTPDTETGAAFDLANAGYRPMPDPDKKEGKDAVGSDSASLRAAVEQRSDAPIEPTIREYQDRDGKRVPQNEAITLARASRDYSDALAAERLISESETSEALAAR